MSTSHRPGLQPLNSRERALALVLKSVGVVDLLAIAAVLMPRSMMAAIHTQLGLGTLAADPVGGYLARTASWFYVLAGALFIWAAQDVRRNRDLITWLASAGLLTGAVLIGVDVAEGLPGWWISAEGPCCLVVLALVLGLQLPKRHTTDSSTLPE